MATLNNFHTGNGGQKQIAQYPHRADRLQVIQLNLPSSSAWDLPNLVPIGPIQTAQPPLLSGSHVDPQLTEVRDHQAEVYFVPTQPYTRMMQGDTADGRILYAPTQRGTFLSNIKSIFSPNRVPVQTKLQTDIY